jgi:hypothetical protein
MIDFSPGDLVEHDNEGLCIVTAVIRETDGQILRVYNSSGRRLPVGENNWYTSHAFRLIAKSQKPSM